MKPPSTLMTLAGMVLPLLLPASVLAKGYQLELGGFAGAHLFSSDNALGRLRGQPGATALQHSGELGLRVAYFFHPRVGVEAELALVPTTTRGAGVDVLAIGYRAQLVANLLTGRVRPFVLAGGGGFSSTSSNHDIILADTDGELHAGVGVKGELNKARTVGLRFDARVQFSPGLMKNIREDYELQLGVYGLLGHFWKPAPPPANPDADGDGVAVSDDRCPDAAGPLENHGCPDRDADGDGIVDRLDRCPAQGGVGETGGCPDGDGDGDGIVDRLDKCPAEAESRNGYQDEDGCPDVDPAAELASRATEGIQFQAGKSELEPSSFPVLDGIARAMLDTPRVTLEIVGHTDNVGARDKNVALSLLRAEAVKQYLVTKGVAAERLNASGLGPDKPVSDNQNEERRAKNRRVEIKFINSEVR